MSRDYSRTSTSIWRDEEFKRLSLTAQWTYNMLTTQADISSVGTLPVTAKRWSSYTTSVALEDIEKALSELESAFFIVIDDESEELLVRTFVKWDGGYKTPKRLLSILSSAESVSSKRIRSVIAYELAKLGIEHSLSDEPYDVKNRPLDTVSNEYPDGIDTYGDTPRVVVTEVSKDPQPTTLNPQPVESGEPLRHDVEEICELLADLIRQNGSKATVSAKWRDAARLMIDRDERPLAEAERLIRWCQDSEFWRGNILSMPTFREKYDKLRLQAERDAKPETSYDRDQWNFG